MTATPRALIVGDRPPITVLLAEDNHVNQLLATAMLQKRGHRVTVAGDGREALRILAGGRFDVILMDIHMPHMGGLEATATIRERERLSGEHIPIVALTALAMSGDREECLKAGMDAYVSKPISADELFGTLERLVPHRTGAAPSRAVAAPRPRVQAAIVDVAKLMANHEGDAGLMRGVLETCLREQPQRERALSEALTRGDAPTLAREAHSLKGILLTLGASAPADVALRLEILARCGNLSDAAGAVNELRGELARLAPVLRELLQRPAA
jgi:two-component system, sensor histidine kinase and response regulator